MEQIVEKIKVWLQNQVKQANANGLIVGVSGGLDSAVIANLIKRAFPNDSLGVIMPINSNPTDLKDAEAVVQACHITSMNVDLTATHALMIETIQQEVNRVSEWHEKNARIADANLRARLRMSTLYTIANNYNYLVVGTDNMAEWFTGYFTKYGDGGVDLQPIVDLTKQEVRELAHFLHVPVEVIEKNPSADLWVGQTDEEEMGTTYAYIDAYLKGEEIPEKDKEVIEQLHARTEHKRNIATQLRLK
ncbi:MAG TPA: NAD(+) synthase [Candidatus Pseudogracilibacillus intestinigallinarum]|uniref:NH(3)-dependent NAD(+) synthetase n=1 Tax=Candidatus Pseudogracilibacillus intestinigallinarum TaxID=2838742 RepID=A0A9D1PMQ5_9BACI|nr:NAD(+) synthase [Candidatus Pseudogracilibacillus intestinigallinarum]